MNEGKKEGRQESGSLLQQREDWVTDKPIVIDGMFWRRRKRNKAAALQAEKHVPDLATFTDQSPHPSSDCGEEDTADAVMDPEEENGNENLGGSQNCMPQQPVNAPRDVLSPKERRARMEQDIMHAQKVLETQALARNSFTKNQRVEYMHKATGKKYEAVVVDVHFDDGLDRPYFTVRYKRSSGNPSEIIEKQTTRDRLTHVAFDEAKTYKILSSKLKL